jgi:hypothetical protein
MYSLFNGVIHHENKQLFEIVLFGEQFEFSFSCDEQDGILPTLGELVLERV